MGSLPAHPISDDEIRLVLDQSNMQGPYLSNLTVHKLAVRRRIDCWPRLYGLPGQIIAPHGSTAASQYLGPMNRLRDLLGHRPQEDRVVGDYGLVRLLGCQRGIQLYLFYQLAQEETGTPDKMSGQVGLDLFCL
jgi:hypothetical protein